MRRQSAILRWSAIVLGISSWWFLSSAQGFAQQGIPQGYVAKNIQPISYVDMEPPFKLAIQEVGGRWYLYMGHLWDSTWSIMDVTDPREPKVLKVIAGPPNTWTLQMELEDGKMVTPLQRKTAIWGGDESKPFEEGFLIWDVSDPVNPKRLNHFKTGGTGSHRLGYFGGPYVHLSSHDLEGFTGSVYQIVDWQKNAEVGRWWVPGQRRGEPPDTASLHGPPYVVDNLAYIPYGQAGLVILDIKDATKPQLVSRLDFHPPFGSTSVGTHTALPLKGRGLAIVSSEAIRFQCDEPLPFAGIVDIKDPKNPRLLSLLPVPVPPPDSPYRNFCEKPGRFGPHNTNHHQHSRFVDHNENILYFTYFNAGLRVFDISDARLPREVAYFIEPTPGKLANRRSPANLARLGCTSCTIAEDVLVDTRGYIYLTDSNQGLWILRLSGG